MIKVSNEENAFVDSLYALSGVSKEDILKVFEAFITHIVLKFYDRVEIIGRKKLINDEIIEFPIPYFASLVRVHVREEEIPKEQVTATNRGYAPVVTIEVTPSEFLKEDIRKVIKNQTTAIEERIQLQIFESLNKKKV